MSDDPFEQPESSMPDWLDLGEESDSRKKKAPVKVPKSQPPKAPSRKVKDSKNKKSDDWLGLDDHQEDFTSVQRKTAESGRKSPPKASPRTDKQAKASAASDWLGLDNNDEDNPISESTTTDRPRSPPKSPTRKSSASDWLGFSDDHKDTTPQSDRPQSPPKSHSRRLSNSDYLGLQDDAKDSSGITTGSADSPRRNRQAIGNTAKSAEAIFGGDDEDIFDLGTPDISTLPARRQQSQPSTDVKLKRPESDQASRLFIVTNISSFLYHLSPL